jgi:hypothetical protein
MSGEQQRMYGSHRQELSFLTAFAAIVDRRLRSPLKRALTAIVNLCWAVGTAAAMIAAVLGLMWAGHHAQGPGQEAYSGSGIVVHTDVTAIWLPRPLLDLVRQQGRPAVVGSPEELQTYLGRYGWTAAWYAMTCRGYQANGDSGEITQTRLLNGAAEHLEEVEAVLATAAGRPPQFERSDFSHARVKVIPDTLQGIDRCEAITRLMAGPTAGDENSPTGGPDSARRTD